MILVLFGVLTCALCVLTFHGSVAAPKSYGLENITLALYDNRIHFQSVAPD
jgi:hypothetical protein